MGAAALLAIAAICVAGCGGGDSTSSSDAGTAGEGKSASAFDPAPFEKLVEGRETPTFPDLPKSPAAKQGANVVALWCALALEGCKRAADAYEEAAQALAWKSLLIDTESLPTKTQAGFQQAENLGAEALIMQSLAPWSLVEPLVNKARGGDIPSVCLACGEPETTGPSDTGLGAEVSNGDAEQAEVSASVLALASEGSAKILLLTDPEFETVVNSENGFKKVFAECSGCEIAKEIKFPAAAISTTLPAEVKAALTADPSIEYVWSSAAAFVPPEVITAVREANPDVKVYSVSANTSQLKEIAEGESSTIAGLVFKPAGWLAYAGVDEVNRLLNGEPPISEEVPFAVVNSENVQEFLNEDESPVDYKAEYKKLWGVQG